MIASSKLLRRNASLKWIIYKTRQHGLWVYLPGQHQFMSQHSYGIFAQSTINPMNYNINKHSLNHLTQRTPTETAKGQPHWNSSTFLCYVPTDKLSKNLEVLGWVVVSVGGLSCLVLVLLTLHSPSLHELLGGFSLTQALTLPPWLEMWPGLAN